MMGVLPWHKIIRRCQSWQPPAGETNQMHLAANGANYEDEEEYVDEDVNGVCDDGEWWTFNIAPEATFEKVSWQKKSWVWAGTEINFHPEITISLTMKTLGWVWENICLSCQGQPRLATRFHENLIISPNLLVLCYQPPWLEYIFVFFKQATNLKQNYWDMSSS